MEPVTVLCSTCQSRIRVRNASLIGKLANCPKCKSLIMIAAPQQILVDNPLRQPVDSMALTRDGIDPSLESTSALPDAYGPADAQRMLPSEDEGEYRLAEYPEDGLEAPPIQSDDLQLSHAQAAVDGQTSWQAGDQPHIPSDEWTSASTAKTRQYLLVGFLGVSGVVLAVVMFVAFLRWYGTAKQPQQVAAAATESLANASSGPAVGNSEQLSAADPELEADEDKGQVVNSPLQAETPVSSTEVDATSLNAQPAAPAVADLTMPANPEGPASDLANGEIPLTPAIQPLAPTTKDLLPNARLMEFAPILEWVVQPTITDTGLLPSAPPLSAEDLGLPTVTSTIAIPPIDWAVHANTKLPGLILSDTLLLSQAMNIWTHVSGVPTFVNLDSFTAADINPNTPISIKLLDVSIAEAAQQLADKLHAVVSERENRYLEFRVSPAVIKAKLPTSLSVADLVADDAGQTWLLTAIEQLFPQSQGGWSYQAGSLAYDPQVVDLMTWFEVVRMLENWRSAGGLPSQLEGYADGRLSMHFVDPDSLSFLEQTVDEISPQARPVGQVLSRICRKAGVSCWIDWSNVGEGGLGTMSTYLAVTNARPLRRILADYVDQYSLVVALEDETSLWITSPRAYRAQTRLYVIPSLGKTPEQWQQQLKSLTPADDRGIGQVQVIATPGGDFILLRCCRPVIKF